MSNHDNIFWSSLIKKEEKTRNRKSNPKQGKNEMTKHEEKKNHNKYVNHV